MKTDYKYEIDSEIRAFMRRLKEEISKAHKNDDANIKVKVGEFHTQRSFLFFETSYTAHSSVDNRIITKKVQEAAANYCQEKNYKYEFKDHSEFPFTIGLIKHEVFIYIYIEEIETNKRIRSEKFERVRKACNGDFDKIECYQDNKEHQEKSILPILEQKRQIAKSRGQSICTKDYIGEILIFHIKVNDIKEQTIYGIRTIETDTRYPMELEFAVRHSQTTKLERIIYNQNVTLEGRVTDYQWNNCDGQYYASVKVAGTMIL